MQAFKETFVSFTVFYLLVVATLSEKDEIMVKNQQSGWKFSHFPHNRQQHYHHHYDQSRWGPFFEEFSNTTTMTSMQEGFYGLVAAVGDSVLLNCRVAMLQDKLVMWVKKTPDQVSLLTVGTSLYSGDSRFQLKFQYPNNWRLEISPVLREDDGLYMCQVSTHPTKVLTTNLTVISPEISIVDENGNSIRDGRYYQIGSKIELTCTAVILELSKYVTTESHLNWTKDNKVFTGKLKTTTYKTENQRTLLSRLIIPQADSSDSGIFTCQLSRHVKAQVHVHVVNGENQAAVHYESSSIRITEKAAFSFILFIKAIEILLWFLLNN